MVVCLNITCKFFYLVGKKETLGCLFNEGRMDSGCFQKSEAINELGKEGWELVGVDKE